MDYSKTIMYKIVCNDIAVTDVYVGHTTDFINRKACHKRNCNNSNRREYSLKLYQYIRENGGWDNFSIIIIEEYPCNNKEEARHRERYWYETLNATLNMVCPIISDEEKREYYKQYEETHKEEKKQRTKSYSETHKEERKQYYQTHKEQKLEYYKLRQKIKYTCECGSVCSITDKSKHYKSIKHQRFLADIKPDLGL